MNGCVFKRELPSGKTSWGYSIDLCKDDSGKRLREFKRGDPTKGAAKNALDAAINEHEQRAGRVTQEVGLLRKRVWAFSLGEVRASGFDSKDAAETALRSARQKLADAEKRPSDMASKAPVTLAEFFTIWIN